MKYTTLFLFLFTVNTPVIAGVLNPEGTYFCKGHYSETRKAYTGTLTIKAHKNGLFRTSWVSGEEKDVGKDVGVLKPTQRKNVYVEYWKIIQGKKRTGLSQFIFNPDGSVSAKFFHVDEKDGLMSSGAGSCKRAS